MSFSNLSWQSDKKSATESCLYGIIGIRITLFLGAWFIVGQLYYTISSEELFVFLEETMPYLYGLWRFANAYFLDIYKKVERNFPQAREVSKKDRITIGKAFIDIAAKYGMTIRPCAEGNVLAEYGADCSGCMTVKTFETALHERLIVPKRKTNQ